jgi:hypothetical protein
MDRESRPNCPLLGGHKLKLGLFGTKPQLRTHASQLLPQLLCYLGANFNDRAGRARRSIPNNAPGHDVRDALGAPALFRSGEERRHSNLNNLQDIAP